MLIISISQEHTRVQYRYMSRRCGHVERWTLDKLAGHWPHTMQRSCGECISPCVVVVWPIQLSVLVIHDADRRREVIAIASAHLNTYGIGIRLSRSNRRTEICGSAIHDWGNSMNSADVLLAYDEE